MNATQSTGLVHDAPTVSRILGLPFESKGPAPAAIGFVTFYDPGWSILYLRHFVVKKRSKFSPQTWYDDEPFAKLAELPGYRQLRMTPVPGSFGKTFAEQRALLRADEEIPSARAVVMGMVLHFLTTHERLFPNHWVRCSDKDSDGDRVYVGGFDRDGLSVSSDWDDYRDSGIGLASSRKF